MVLTLGNLGLQACLYRLQDLNDTFRALEADEPARLMEIFLGMKNEFTRGGYI